ncbi:hypothetical protein [Catellatospora sp. NPDC049609]|uniref:hypothetical protein n=1 Tax=Catellatospora sp. NPDC049609 TaxID=3155505 RepID=UPI003442D100
MAVSRRGLLGAALLGVASAAVPLGLRPASAAAAGLTTLNRTLAVGPASPGGYRPVTTGSGEPHTVRRDLAGGTAPTVRSRALAAFAQLTDMQLADAQSPARVDFLDRYADVGGPSWGRALGDYRSGKSR